MPTVSIGAIKAKAKTAPKPGCATQFPQSLLSTLGENWIARREEELGGVL